MPGIGMVSILSVTDKQYGDIVNYWGKEKKKKHQQSLYNWNFFGNFALSNLIHKPLRRDSFIIKFLKTRKMKHLRCGLM